MNESSVRRGEWLEVPVQHTSLDSIEEWLTNHAGIPLKLLQQLKLSQGIRLKSDRVLLHLFPHEADDYQADWQDIEILFEDDFCLVVNKPAGFKVHPAKPGDDHTLGHAVAAHYMHSGQSCRIRHIHRLDEHTSGAVLYAKNELAQLKLDEQMRAKLIHREYIAFVEGIVKSSKGRMDEPIGKDRHHPNRRRVSQTGEPAVTHYERMEQLHQATLLQLRLETGRTHQIRVHLSHHNHPIIGDILYGGNHKRIGRQALHGHILTFTHPFYQHQLEVEAPWPADLIELHMKLRE